MALSHIAPALVRVGCSEDIHAIIWRAGALELADHSDPAAERALTALGGAPCRCVELLDAWERASDDPRSLLLGPRGPMIRHVEEDPSPGPSPIPALRGPRGRMGASRTLFAGSGRARPAAGAARGPEEPAPDPVEELVSLGGAIPHRLVATVAAALAGRRHEPALRAQLYAALYGRVLVALGRWLGELPELELTMIDAGAAPSLTRDGDVVTAALPFEWLVDVWGTGLTTVADRFVIAATPRAPAGWELLCVDQLMAVNTCTLKLQ